MSYPPEFLDLVDRFIHLANEAAEGGQGGEVSAAIPFAAGRFNRFDFVSDLAGAVGPAIGPQA